MAQRDGMEDGNGLRMGAADVEKLAFWLKLGFFVVPVSTCSRVNRGVISGFISPTGGP